MQEIENEKLFFYCTQRKKLFTRSREVCYNNASFIPDVINALEKSEEGPAFGLRPIRIIRIPLGRDNKYTERKHRL